MKTCILTHSSLFGQKSGERWGVGGGGGGNGRVCVFSGNAATYLTTRVSEYSPPGPRREVFRFLPAPY